MTTKIARIKEIDVLYSIGALLAILGHSHPNNWNSFEGTLFYHCIVFIYTFHMALFFFIAGVLLMHSKGIETKSFGAFSSEKAFKLLTPYFVLTLLTFIPKGYLEHRNFEFLNIQSIASALFNPRGNTWGHFWFLPVLFIRYLLFGLLRKWISKLKTETQIIVLAVCALFFAILVLRPPCNTDWFGINDIFHFAFYIPLGMLLGKLHQICPPPPRFIPPLCSIILFGIAIPIYIFFYTTACARFTLSLLMIFSLLCIAYLLRNKFENVFAFLSKNIFTIYIYSWPFQSIALMIFEKYELSWRICAPVMFVTGILCPLILISVYKRFKKLNCHFFDLLLGIR